MAVLHYKQHSYKTNLQNKFIILNPYKYGNMMLNRILVAKLTVRPYLKKPFHSV